MLANEEPWRAWRDESMPVLVASPEKPEKPEKPDPPSPWLCPMPWVPLMPLMVLCGPWSFEDDVAPIPEPQPERPVCCWLESMPMPALMLLLSEPDEEYEEEDELSLDDPVSAPEYVWSGALVPMPADCRPEASLLVEPVADEEEPPVAVVPLPLSALTCFVGLCDPPALSDMDEGGAVEVLPEPETLFTDDACDEVVGCPVFLVASLSHDKSSELDNFPEPDPDEEDDDDPPYPEELVPDFQLPELDPLPDPKPEVAAFMDCEVDVTDEPEYELNLPAPALEEEELSLSLLLAASSALLPDLLDEDDEEEELLLPLPDLASL